MLVKLQVASQWYSFASPQRCQAAIDGLEANAARYAAKAEVASRTARLLREGMAAELEKDRVKKAAARKAAKVEEQEP